MSAVLVLIGLMALIAPSCITPVSEVQVAGLLFLGIVLTVIGAATAVAEVVRFTRKSS